MKKSRIPIRKMALMGLFLAMVVILSAIEQLLPPLPFLPPNTKLGLSNVIVMYTLVFLGVRYGYTMAFLKSVFVFFMRGAIASIVSLSGGLLSLTFMVIVLKLFGSRASYTTLGIVGAMGHNIGQLAAASLVLGRSIVLFYAPFLLISGVIFGAVTGIALGILMPVLGKITNINNNYSNTRNWGSDENFNKTRENK